MKKTLLALLVLSSFTNVFAGTTEKFELYCWVSVPVDRDGNRNLEIIAKETKPIEFSGNPNALVIELPFEHAGEKMKLVGNGTLFDMGGTYHTRIGMVTAKLDMFDRKMSLMALDGLQFDATDFGVRQGTVGSSSGVVTLDDKETFLNYGCVIDRTLE